jgi:hypothetical protein
MKGRETVRFFRLGSARFSFVLSLPGQKFGGTMCELTFGAGELSGSALVSHLRRFGAAVIAGCFPKGTIGSIFSAANRIYSERDALEQRGELPQALQDMHILKRSIPLGEVSDAGEALAIPLLREAASISLGRDAELGDKSYVRTIYPDPNSWHLPFHQDQSIFAHPLFNLWIPLTSCGVDAPGLEVVTAGLDNELETFSDEDSQYAAAKKQIRESDVLASFADQIWHPAMEPGDVLVFLGTTIHRSYVTPEMNKPRTSIELRLI